VLLGNELSLTTDPYRSSAFSRCYRHADKGPISYLIGSKVYYDVADLDEWLATQKAATLRGGVARGPRSER